jgi:integrase
VTRLRKMMLEELQRRNYSEHTTRYYIRTVEDFARRFNRPADRLGPRHIRKYQAELFQKRKLSSGTVTIRLAALRFFYIKTLKKAWSIAETPYPKRAVHFPSILSKEEVTRLIDAALSPYHRVLLMTLYATGVRNAELTRLKVSDIDSKRMVIHIQGGNGRTDRDVMLSPKLLAELREHWRLSFAKTPQGLDSGSRNNVTGHSHAYSFQPRFEILTRNRQEGGRYVIDFKDGQNFGEPQPRISPEERPRGIPVYMRYNCIYKDGGTRTFPRRCLVRIRQPDRTGGAALPSRT